MCKNDHVEVKQQKDKVKRTINFMQVGVEKENVLTVHMAGETIIIHDGSKKTEIDTDEYNTMKKSNKYIMINCESEHDMSEQRELYLNKADILLKESNGLINYYKSPYSSAIAFDLFRKKS